MVLKGPVFILITSVLNLIFCNNHDNLISVVVVYRHGDRTPGILYKNDPYQEDFWNVPLGELTNKGKQRQFELGQWFRNRYDGFLSKRYNASEIKVFSTDIDRALMSAGANLAGLYPPVDDQIWNEDIKWQPIPIHLADTSLFMAVAFCEKFMQIREKFFNYCPVVKSILDKNADLLKYLSEHTGENISDVNSASGLWDTLYAESHANLTLPDWTTNVFPDKMMPITLLWALSFGSTPRLARFSSGTFLHTVIDHFENMLKGLRVPKFLMFSAHDLNIISILSGLGAYQVHIPFYSNTILFELRNGTNGPFVNVFYKQENSLDMVQVKGCPLNCHLGDFKSILADITVSIPQFWKECGK